MPTATIKFDAFSWMEKDEVTEQVIHRTAWKGDTVELSDAEYQRGAKLGAFEEETSEVIEAVALTPGTPEAAQQTADSTEGAETGEESGSRRRRS